MYSSDVSGERGGGSDGDIVALRALLRAANPAAARDHLARWEQAFGGSLFSRLAHSHVIADTIEFVGRYSLLFALFVVWVALVWYLN